MRFAFISTMQGSPWGGSEELWSQSAAQLKRAGHQVMGIVMYRPQVAQKLVDLQRSGIELETYPSPGFLIGRAQRLWDLVSLRYRRTRRRLRNFRPDLVLISQGHTAGAFDWVQCCLQANIPYAIVIHCNSDLWWFDERGVREAVLTYTQARRVFCVSDGNRKLLRLQVGDPLPNAVVAWNPCSVAGTSAPSWPSNKTWRLACVGRLDPAPKGQDLLLQILARPEWRSRPIEVNFFGAGPYERTLHRLAEMLRMKNVFFRGHVNNIRAVWEQNHALVLPSRYEGLPLTLVEAMWCARPAIVTDVGGNAELCADNETGFVSPASTLPSFAEALDRAWNRRHDWQVIGQAAMARVEAQAPKDPIKLFCDRLMDCTVIQTKPS